jgi:hypothetical protein
MKADCGGGSRCIVTSDISLRCVSICRYSSHSRTTRKLTTMSLSCKPCLPSLFKHKFKPYDEGSTRTGWSLEFGGVSLLTSCSIVSPSYLATMLVIFQQPRPGPSLPQGEHYYSIGWRQVYYSRIRVSQIILIAF